VTLNGAHALARSWKVISIPCVCMPLWMARGPSLQGGALLPDCLLPVAIALSPLPHALPTDLVIRRVTFFVLLCVILLPVSDTEYGLWGRPQVIGVQGEEAVAPAAKAAQRCWLQAAGMTVATASHHSIRGTTITALSGGHALCAGR
jgi:hypothetical protein